MTVSDLFENSGGKLDALPVTPPFIWPEARFHAGLADYAKVPPARDLFADADLISGVLVGAADGTIRWLDQLRQVEGKRRILLVLVLFPAGPTREEHLRAINTLLAPSNEGEQSLEVRLLPIADIYGGDFNWASLPPTVIQGHNTRTARTVMSIGSVNDAGDAPITVGSLNFVFEPDDALRNGWRQWFQYVFSSAAPLIEDTLQIPYLVPAKGDPEAARLWEAFELTCRGKNSSAKAAPEVDPVTGDVKTDAGGEEVVPWDGGQTALDPLALIFQQVYASGWLVTVDEATRIKPLTMPVNATLLGQQAGRTVGALRQRQSFTLQVLDDAVDKAIEKCRKVTDLFELLTYPLSQGNRWLPDAAKGLLEKELESRNKQGHIALWDALGGGEITPEAAKSLVDKELKSGDPKIHKALQTGLGNGDCTPEAAKNLLKNGINSDNKELKKACRNALGGYCITQFIAKRTESIRKDLNEMYRQLGQGNAVPEDKLKTVLDEVEQRLKQALETRITPRAVYNPIGAPNITATAPDENWNQPLSLLARSARILRESLTDPFFPRRFTNLSFSADDFRKSCDVFEDDIVARQEGNRAKLELNRVDEIINATKPIKEKCQDVWRLIKGEQPDSRS